MRRHHRAEGRWPIRTQGSPSFGFGANRKCYQECRARDGHSAHACNPNTLGNGGKKIANSNIVQLKETLSSNKK